MDLPKEKAPGQDGIPSEFYQEFFDEIQNDLLELVTEVYATGRLAASLNTSKICLLPKTGDLTLVTNYRPISLLGTAYKIIAKLIANRMIQFLPLWIKQSQTAFVKGRSIFDNVFMAFEAMDWAENSGQDLILLLLDFEKAYDRVSWSFLEATMRKMGFADIFIAWIMALYKEASALVLLNGAAGPTFELERSVRQGCPLAPYLYLLIADVLGHMLEDPKRGVQGFTLPDGNTTTSQMFADDANLLLQGSEQNLDAAIQVLNLFCQGSGAVVNWRKTVGIWASRRPRTWHWNNDSGLKWLQEGECTIYLGFPIGFKMRAEERDNKVLLMVSRQLTKWSPRHMSLAGRILLANQVMLATIWYLCSCASISLSALKQSRGLVRNYIWGAKIGKTTRAKVRWELIIQPISAGGLKILDPIIQASALISKLVVRGLKPGWEPWKTFVRFHVDQAKYTGYAHWLHHRHWFMHAKAAQTTSTQLWRCTFKAWTMVRTGLEQIQPRTQQEILRQPLFGNYHLRCFTGTPWGLEQMSNLGTWQRNNTFTIQDIWDPTAGDWKSEATIKRQTRSRTAAIQRQEIIDSIPWRITIYQPPQTGEWVTPDIGVAIHTVYHVTSIEDGQHKGLLYIRLKSEELVLADPIPFEITANHLEQVRVIVTSGLRATVRCYNPTLKPRWDEQVWLFGNCPIQQLPWDPADWRWRRQGMVKECEFFSYTTKLGYKIGLSKVKATLPILVDLKAFGFTNIQLRLILQRTWHPWLPRKIATMSWLTMAGGLPVGEWRRKAGWEGHCRLCNDCPFETAEHGLMRCKVVKEAWERYASLRDSAGLRNDCASWKGIMLGPLHRPGLHTIQDDETWGSGQTCMVSNNTAWDILRTILLWNIWVQKCDEEMNGNAFHLGKALYYAWQTTVHVGMEVWEDITRHNRSGRRINAMQDKFFEIWGKEGVFCTVGGLPKWHTLPPECFLPFHLATEPPRRIDVIPLREEPNQASDAASSLDLDLNAAIDAMFEDVLEDLANRVIPLEIAQELDDEVTGEPAPPKRVQSPILDDEETIRTRCVNGYTVNHLIYDSSPRTAARLDKIV
jgi:hypothetical protein